MGHTRLGDYYESARMYDGGRGGSFCQADRRELCG